MGPRSARTVPVPTVPPTSFSLDSGCALYLRVSSEEQDLTGQERDLRAEAARRGWAVVAVYAEKVTGHRQGREGRIRTTPPQRT